MDMNTATLPKKGLKKYDYNIDMEKKDLKKLTKEQLIELLLKQERKKPKVVIVDDTKPTRLNRPPPIQEVVQRIKPTPPPRTGKWKNLKPKHLPRIIEPPEEFSRSVKDLVKNYEENIIEPPKEFRDKPRFEYALLIGMKRYKKPNRRPPAIPTQVEDYIIKPIPKPRTDRLLQMQKPTKPTRRPPPIPTRRPTKPTRRPLPIPTRRPTKPTRRPPPIPTQKPPKPTRSPPEIPITKADVEITELRKALKNSTKSYTIDIVNFIDPISQLKEARDSIRKLLIEQLISMKGFNYVETLKVTFKKKIDRGSIQTKYSFFNNKARKLINAIDIKEALSISIYEICKAIAVWTSEGSGWTIASVDAHYVNLTQYQPLRGSSYIELPKELQNPAKGLINLQNKDEACFGWCHVRHLNPKKKDPQRITKSDNKFIQDKIVNYDGIEFPVTIKDFNKIEKMNSINVNVFGYEEGEIFPLYISKEKFEDHMELLLITEGKKTHYALIKDFNKLMYTKTRHKERKHFCMHCLQCFSTDIVLKNHVKNCIEINGAQAVRMPTKNNNVLKFENHHKGIRSPFTIYADLEAILQKVEKEQPDSNSVSETLRNNFSYTEKFQKHIDCGAAYKVVCCYDDRFTKDISIYRGEKAVYKFLENMLEEVEYCKGKK